MVSKFFPSAFLARRISAVLLTLALMAPNLMAEALTLEEALDIALNRTTRGEMIEGNLEVAEQLYSARRINMYLPEISINGSVPSYLKSQSYEPLRGQGEYGWSKRRNLDFSSFVELKQSLITGGSLTATADLISQDKRLPDTRGWIDTTQDYFINQLSREGSFSLTLDQPLFRPSSVKNELHNRADDLEIARVTRAEQTAELEREIVEAYLGVLQARMTAEIATDRLEKARLQEGIDSLKLSDGVLSEEDFLLSGSSRLDAELEKFSADTELGEKQRELATLLDLDVDKPPELFEPTVRPPLPEAERKSYIDNWEESAPIKKAAHQLAKAEREAAFEAAGHGLTGDLAASLSLGQQKIENEYEYVTPPEDLDFATSSWTVALQFKLPVWDGGAGSAAIRAARYQAEQDRYEFTRAQRSARAQITNLIHQLEVSHQRLDIIQKQIGLAENRLEIARGRFDEGRISRLTFLESRIFLLETRDQYLEELKEYLTNRIDLDSQYLN